MQRRNTVFIALFALSLAAMLLFIMLDPRRTSSLENRTLTSFPAFSASGFLSGEDQDALEQALGDHMPASEEIRGAVRHLESSVLDAEQRLIFRLEPGLQSGYVQIAEGYYAWGGDEHRIVERPDVSRSVPEGLKAFAEQVNALSGIRKVLYWIDNSRSVDFDHADGEPVLRETVRGLFRTEAGDCFTFDGYDDYCSWFYQTDHHWNNRGSYRGYTEILALLRPEDPPAEPVEEVTFPFVFNGSYARQASRLCADEPFRIYRFDLPKAAVTLNGKRGTYGKMDAYLKGKYGTDSLTNHYSICYGGEYGEIVYDTGSEGRGRLLIIASSYSNPINGLLASHFDRTCVIDPRYYAEWAGHPLDLSAYTEEHGITDLLLLGDLCFFAEDLAGGAAEGDDA